MAQPIAYMMSRFPHLSETFILREMLEMERLGWEVKLFPLMLQQQAVVHDEAKRWIPLAQPQPFISPHVALSSLQRLVKQPLKTSSIVAKTLAESATAPSELVRKLALIPKAITLAKHMQAQQIAHIHCHYATYPAFAAWIINRLTGIPYSFTVHGHDIFVNRAMLPTKARGASAIMAIAEFHREFLVEKLGEWVRDRIHIVHCGIRPERYQPQPKPAGERFEILTTGSLQDYKGHPFLIQACSFLRDRGVAFRCRIIGGGEDRPMLEQLIAEKQLTGMVELLGPQPETAVRELLATADCYVQASIITPSGKMEGIPVSLMEALACELPVVASRMSGIPELVRHGETGYLVPPANAAALADQLLYVRDHPEEAASYAARGRELVQSDFNLVTCVEKLSETLLAVNPALQRPIQRNA
ncbi:glycosyltransferase [Herpetosiphon gulosus]|uniref:D-inositol-3-phosphate glycosyltransferase n=1 Tax=Herpetosiphon gulosus TaxID=1973496 RepID=A0ABP9WTL2_9CHLR